MEAKDTVIKIEDLTYAILLHPDLPMGQAVAEEQAKVSFKAGQDSVRNGLVCADCSKKLKQEGRLSMAKEIIFWVEHSSYITIEGKAWDKKVKEWLEEQK